LCGHVKKKKKKNSENVFMVIIIGKCEEKKMIATHYHGMGSSLPNKPHILNSTVHPSLQLLLGGGCHVYLAGVRVVLKGLSMVRFLLTSFFWNSNRVEESREDHVYVRSGMAEV
jgi:hypothetical protein